jgi:hypothetical protein
MIFPRGIICSALLGQPLRIPLRQVELLIIDCSLIFLLKEQSSREIAPSNDSLKDYVRLSTFDRPHFGELQTKSTQSPSSE